MKSLKLWNVDVNSLLYCSLLVHLLFFVHFVGFSLEYCGTVPNPEKSRLSRPAGQSGLSRKFFGTGQTGSGQYRKKPMSRIFLSIYENVSYQQLMTFLGVSQVYVNTFVFNKLKYKVEYIYIYIEIYFIYKLSIQTCFIIRQKLQRLQKKDIYIYLIYIFSSKFNDSLIIR